MQRIALVVAKLLVPTHGDISSEKPLEAYDPRILKPVRRCAAHTQRINMVSLTVNNS